MAFVRQSSSLLAKVLSGGGGNFAIPSRWTQSTYGSGWPITPISAPKDVEFPRSIDYPIAVNTTLVPRIAYGLMPFASLLQAYENVAEVRSAVGVLVRELQSFPPHLLDKDGNVSEDHPYLWMTKAPDRKTPFGVWLTRFLKSAKVYDAPAVYLQRDSSGLINALHYVDGSTLFVIVDQFGNIPAPESISDYVARIKANPPAPRLVETTGSLGPSTVQDFIVQYVARYREGKSVPTKVPAYTQIVKGTPFSWWAADDIWYMPQSRRMNAPYGESFIETAWAWIMIIANLTAFELGHYRTGNMPEGFLTLPKDWFATPDAVMAAEGMFNDRMTSNPVTERNRLRFFPEGTTYTPTKAPDFPTDLYMQAWKNIMHAIGVPTSELGDIPGGGLGGKGFKEGASMDLSRQTLNPHRDFVASFFNYVLERNGVDDVTFSLDYPIEEIDPDKLKESLYQGMAHGTLSLNDALGQLGLMPVGDPQDKANIANKHLIVAGSTIYVIEDMTTENGAAVATFGAPPADPEAALLMDGKEHTSEDRKTLERLLKQVIETGTLDGKFISLPPAPSLTKDLPNVEIVTSVTSGSTVSASKISQSAANYTPIASNPQTTCARCAHFLAPSGCQIVEGTIAPEGWCQFFVSQPSLVEMVKKAVSLTGVETTDDEYYGAAVSHEAVIDLPDGVHANAVELIALTPDGLPPRAALWKPEGGEMTGLQMYIGGAQYVREEAAYLLDRSLGFQLVPVAYVSESAGEVGTAVLYAFSATKGEAIAQYAPLWIERAAVLDGILGQLDRGAEGHNYLTYPGDTTRPILIDNGLSFPIEQGYRLRSAFYDAWHGKTLSKDILAALTLCQGDASLWFDITGLVGDMAVQGARERLKQFITSGILDIQSYATPAPDTATTTA